MQQNLDLNLKTHLEKIVIFHKYGTTKLYVNRTMFIVSLNF